MLRFRRVHWVLVPGVLLPPSLPLKIAMHVSPKHGGQKQKKTPHVSHEHCLFDSVCQRYVLGLSIGKRDALLRPRKPAHAGACAHHSRTGKPTFCQRGLANTVCIRAYDGGSSPEMNPIDIFPTIYDMIRNGRCIIPPRTTLAANGKSPVI